MKYVFAFFVSTLLFLTLMSFQEKESSKTEKQEVQESSKAAISDEEIKEAILKAVNFLLDRQKESGLWSDPECKNRPEIGGRIATTSLCCLAFLAYPQVEKKRSTEALQKGIEYLLKATEDKKKLKPLQKSGSGFDWNSWGLSYTILAFLQMRPQAEDEKIKAQMTERIQNMLEALKEAQNENGGWSYLVVRKPSQSFLSAAVMQALLKAQEEKFAVDEEMLTKGLKGLLSSRKKDGAYAYNYTKAERAPLKGALGRLGICEGVLLSGKVEGISSDTLKTAVENFFRHREELEKVRQVHDHVGKYANAGYYYYFGHYYTALALSHLPSDVQQKYYPVLTEALLKTQEKDGSFIDAPCGGKPYGTAMVLLTLATTYPLKDTEELRRK